MGKGGTYGTTLDKDGWGWYKILRVVISTVGEELFSGFLAELIFPYICTP
jgi:hypothetical protein